MKAVVAEQTVVERSENGDKEKKKKRRSRRSKHNTVGCAADEVPGEASGSGNVNKTINCNSSSRSKQQALDSHPLNEPVAIKASNVAFNSLPSMHINKQSGLDASRDMERQPDISAKSGGTVLSKSCPEPLVSEYLRSTCMNEDLNTLQQFEGSSLRRMFVSHWSMDAVNDALEKGEAFKALFRVNAHNRNEAYCKIEGVQTDVLINGTALQNRAVEGDIVAIKLDPFSLWPKMKGSVSNNSSHLEVCNILAETNGPGVEGFKGKGKVDVDYDNTRCMNDVPLAVEACQDDRLAGEKPHQEVPGEGSHTPVDQCQTSTLSSSGGWDEYMDAARRLSTIISSFPSKRPTGRVVAIIENSLRRDSIVGFLNVRHWLFYREVHKTDSRKDRSQVLLSDDEFIQLVPTDPRFPKMFVVLRDLPGSIRKRLESGDSTVEMELVAAQISDWDDGIPCPQAQILHIFGRGGELEPQINAILYQNSVWCSDFSPESLSCLPPVPWEVPQEEFQHRKDLRSSLIFTIDPSTATDLDDALSIERLSNGVFRVGVHIADVSHFVLPDTPLDVEAQVRSTSVYMLQKKLPMLPPLLSENLSSLNPGVDRLAFSIFWYMTGGGDVIDWWIGRTIIRSCCKLSYEHAQDIIDGIISVENLKAIGNGWPQLHGSFDWHDMISSVKSLNDISKMLRQNRFDNGALQLGSSKLVFLFDEDGTPYDTMLCGLKDSNFLVEEFMLLANRTAAEIISRAYPDSALLRRHPEPNVRKLKEFEAFCLKHGLQLDPSSSGRFHKSLEQIREKLKGDSILFDILLNYATKPMQLAVYFCTGDLKEKMSEWNHYALAVPLYTHFTSPLRRYPDIVVHRTLAAAIEAEELFCKHRKMSPRRGEVLDRCFTGFYFDKDAAESLEGKEVLLRAALKHGVPSTKTLVDVAAYCNEKKLACRHVKDACDKLYTWFLLKRKQVLVSEARVMGVGPRFMSIYIQKLGIERRIYYDEVEGLFVEWLEATSTLVLNKRMAKKSGPSYYRALEEVAHVVNPYDLSIKARVQQGTSVFEFSAMTISDAQESGPASKDEVEPGFFPLTVRLFSTIPVALHAVGGHDGPVDIGVRLYMSSYLK